MPKGVDALVNSMQHTSRQPTFNWAPANTGGKELPPRYQSVLALSKRRKDLVDRSSARFYASWTEKRARISHSGDCLEPRRTRGAQNAKRGSSPPVPPLALIP